MYTGKLSIWELSRLTAHLLVGKFQAVRAELLLVCLHVSRWPAGDDRLNNLPARRRQAGQQIVGRNVAPAVREDRGQIAKDDHAPPGLGSCVPPSRDTGNPGTAARPPSSCEPPPRLQGGLPARRRRSRLCHEDVASLTCGCWGSGPSVRHPARHRSKRPAARVRCNTILRDRGRSVTGVDHMAAGVYADKSLRAAGC